MTDEIADLKEELAALKQRVAALEEQHNTDGRERGESKILDHYDERAIDEIGDVHTASPRQIVRAYGKTGIVDDAKKKQRAKRLKRLAADGEI